MADAMYKDIIMLSLNSQKNVTCTGSMQSDNVTTQQLYTDHIYNHSIVFNPGKQTFVRILEWE